MAKAEQIKALIKSHGSGDEERFYYIALQVAATAARQGHTRFARELRDLIDQVRSRKAGHHGEDANSLPPPSLPRELTGLVRADRPRVRLSEMVLEPRTRERLQGVLHEQRQRVRLHQHGLSPARKLLLVGQPGTGKTMTASVLACELEIPLLSIQLDGLITKFLGETAAKLRLIFDGVQKSRGVYLFDEFDSLGSERSNRNEVGEIRRVLNSFLQFLEQDVGDSLVIAATNHPDLLDKALFRRFDNLITFELPSPGIIEDIVKNRLCLFETGELEWSRIKKSAVGLSHGDIAQACDQALKQTILNDSDQVDTAIIISALEDRTEIGIR